MTAARILNQAQAEAVYSAMCALGRLGIPIDIRAGVVRATETEHAGVLVSVSASTAEQYDDQSAFASAYGLISNTRRESMQAVHAVPFPFVRDTYIGPEGEVVGWRPGTRVEYGGDGDPSYNDEEWQADGMGHMLITEYQTVKVPGYVERTFYSRAWRDPDGREFGKKKLRITATPAFKRMLKGYRHSFQLPD